MRTLVLLRHAKAEHPHRVADTDRPLTPRGHADAAAAGAWLVARTLRPDLVLCSPSRRTRETWHGVRVALGDGAATIAVIYDPGLYEGGAGEMLKLVQGADAGIEVLLVIGHNPSISLLSALLDQSGVGADGLRTAGLAVHRVDGTWAECGAGNAPLTANHTARA